MDFNFTDEQNMVRDGISRLIREQYDWDTRREVIASESGWRPELWAQLAELGMLAAPFSEEDGGFGGGATETMLIMEEFGKGLVVEPFLATLLAGTTLATAGSHGDLLETAIAGGGQMALAHGEPASRYTLSHVETKAESTGNGYRLNGNKAVVFSGGSAETLVVYTYGTDMWEHSNTDWVHLEECNSCL